METKDAIKQLLNIVAAYQDTCRSIRRKRSWRESEKAMSIAMYKRRIEAVEYAIDQLSKL